MPTVDVTPIVTSFVNGGLYSSGGGGGGTVGGATEVTAAAILAETQSHTAIANASLLKLEDVRAITQGARDIAAQVRDKLPADPSTDRMLKALLDAQEKSATALNSSLTTPRAEANGAGAMLIQPGVSKSFMSCKMVRAEAIDADASIKIGGTLFVLPKNRVAEWNFDGAHDGSIEVNAQSGTVFVTYTFFEV
jgi:hypothetical protein